MKRRGVTLIELITVITIIAMLAAVLLPALGKARQKAKYATAERNIDQLVTALTGYASDYGFYPIGNGSNSQGLINALEAYGSGSPKGPYISLPSNQKDTTDNSWKDPWWTSGKSDPNRNVYKYRYPLSSSGDSTEQDCLKRGIQFQIWSIGLDGVNDYGTGGTGNDDITNW